MTTVKVLVEVLVDFSTDDLDELLEKNGVATPGDCGHDHHDLIWTWKADTDFPEWEAPPLSEKLTKGIADE